MATAVARRVLDSVTSRHLHIGELHIDTAARTVDIAGRAVAFSRLEFELPASSPATRRASSPRPS